MSKLKIVLVIFFTLLIAFLVFAYLAMTGKIVLGGQPEVVANVVDLDKVKEISKFRSCNGHVVVPSDSRETMRNMKHYFGQKDEYNNTVDKIEIYAPFDGYISGWRPSGPNENNANLWITKSPLPLGRWGVSVDHIAKLDSLKVGNRVKTGQLIGYADLSNNHYSFDFIYSRPRLPTVKIDNWDSPYADLDSIFNHMSEDVLAQYREKGVTSKDQLIISKESRDANPCVYDGSGPYFSGDENTKEDNWVRLND